MRRSLVLFTAACLAATLVAGASVCAGEYPYTAHVTREAEIFAGPGHKYYATDRLTEGTAVEVYAEDEATGFLAVRPLEQCFSWVPAEHVRVEEGEPKVAEVVTPTHSWIGTSVEHIREHKFQVRLPVNELLTVIGERQIQTGDGQKQTWLKIVPPAGEFRWIAPKSVGRGDDSQAEPDDADAKIELAALQKPRVAEKEDKEDVAGDEKDAAPVAAIEKPRRAAVPAIALRDIRADGTPADDRGAVKQAQFAQSTSSPPAKPKSTGDGFVPRKPRTLEAGSTTPSPLARDASTVPRGEPRVARLDRNYTSPSQSTSKLSNGELVSSAEVKRQLDAVEVDLSLMLAQPKEGWNLSLLRSRVQELVDHGETAADRGEARLMLQKLDQIAQTFNVADEPAGASAGSTGMSAVAKEAADPRYDGTGWLKPVLSRTRHVAPYALVDGDGKPICFVTPSPGFRIEGYVNKRVGVYGRRGVVESLNAQHVLAERVIDLEKQLR